MLFMVIISVVFSRHARLFLPTAAAAAAVTCADGLPADGEGSPGLDGVAGDGTVAVGARGPGQLDGGVGDVSHLQSTGGAGGSCGRQTDRRVRSSLVVNQSFTAVE